MKFLETVELFKGIDTKIIQEISLHAVEEEIEQGRVLFQKGDFAEHLYILREGTIELTIEGEVPISFAVPNPGDVFGWSALVEPHRYTAKAECRTKGKVIKIRGDRLVEVFQKYPSEALTVMKRLAKVIATRPVGKFTLRFGGSA